MRAAKLAALLIGCAVSLSASVASAQDYIPGTVPYEVALEGIRINGRNYGIIGALERNVLPQLDNAEKGTFLLFLEHNHLWNAVAVPAVDMDSGTTPWTIRMAKLDLIASSLSFGYSFGQFKLFGGWSMTGTQTFGRWFDPMAPIVNGALGWLIPLMGSDRWNNMVKDVRSYGDYDRLGRSSWLSNHNWVLGGIAELGPLRVRAGYVGSKGIYGAVSAPEIGAFAQSSLTEGFSQFAYLRAGFDGLIQPMRELERFGASVRKVDWTATSMPPAYGEEVASSDLQRAAFWTGHGDLRDIGEIIDLGGAMSFTPKTDLHEAHLTLHTRGFNGKYDRKAGRAMLEKKSDYLGITVGVVKLPNLYFYGIEGGMKPVVNVTFKGRGGALMLRMNDPEVLSVFPFAYNSVNLYFQLGGDLNDP